VLRNRCRSRRSARAERLSPPPWRGWSIRPGLDRCWSLARHRQHYRGLLAAGWPLERIIAYERESVWWTFCAARFAASGPWSETPPIWNGSYTGWVSIRCQPWCRACRSNGFRARRNCAVLRPCFARLGSDGHFLQLTKRLLVAIADRAARHWPDGKPSESGANVPPAQIWPTPRTRRRLERMP